MIVYLLLVFEILVLNSQRKKGKLSDEGFCKIICISFILITGLRHNDVGSDTTVYYFSFNSIASRFTILHDLLQGGLFDTGFYVVFWIVAKLFKNFTFMTLLCACIFYIPLSVLIYRYSSDYGLSYLALMAFNFFQFSMTGMRQTMAFGFVICLILEMKNDTPNYMRCLLFYFLAAMMHRSALVTGVYFLFRLMKNNKAFIRFSIIIVPLCYITRNRLVTILAGLYEDVGYSKTIEFSNGNAGLTTYLVFCLLIFTGLICFDRYRECEQTANIDYMAMMVGTIFLGFVSVISVMFRIAWYFSIIIVIYLPAIIKYLFCVKSNYFIANLGTYFGVLYMYVFITIGSATVLPYKFFFQ